MRITAFSFSREALQSTSREDRKDHMPGLKRLGRSPGHPPVTAPAMAAQHRDTQNCFKLENIGSNPRAQNCSQGTNVA